jgi:hypothetical protein
MRSMRPDSVTRSLPSALRNLERDLKGNLSRSRILISCRVSDWRAENDRREIQSTLLKRDLKQEVKVFALAPLVEQQVVLLASITRWEMSKHSSARPGGPVHTRTSSGPVTLPGSWVTGAKKKRDVLRADRGHRSRVEMRRILVVVHRERRRGLA